jgi:hypothetical protein
MSSRTASIVLSVDVDASPEATFAAATDWPGHPHWMLLTGVEATHGDGASVGTELRAVTGLRLGLLLGASARYGLVDTMRILDWSAPTPQHGHGRCTVRHTGRVVRGDAEFAVAPRPDGSSVFIWSERIDLPFGALGAVGWKLAGPAFTLALRISLRRFARWAPLR